MRISTSLALLAALPQITTSLQAQNVTRVAPVPAAIKDAGTYHVATGQWTRSHQTYGILNEDVLFRNDPGGGYFGLADQSDFLYEEGRLPGEGAPLLPGQPFVGTADTYEISGFQFGYCALSPSTLSLTLGFLTRYSPCTDPSGLAATAEFVTSALPTSGCWIVAFDLTGTTLEFVLDAEGADGSWDNDSVRDSFGYYLNFDAGQGDGTGQVSHGPILAGDAGLPDSFGDGTKWKNTGNGGTGLGSDTFYWLTSATVPDGCYFFGGSVTGPQITVFGRDGLSEPGICTPGGANSVSTEGAVLSSQGGFGTANADFLLEDVPAQPGVLFTGPDIGMVPFGCGERCVVGAGIVRYGPFNVGAGAGQSFEVTIDMGISSNSNIQYWYRDPANAACGASFNLSNGLFF